MKSNVSVKIIDHNIDELFELLNKIKGGLNIIYSNCTFDIKIGHLAIKERKFNTFLYNEESDILILLAKDGLVSKDYIIDYLESKNKSVAEINFMPLEHINQPKEKTPDICVCRDKFSLERAIIDSLKKEIDSCVYSPDASSYFMLGYRTNYRSSKMEIDGRKFKGFIKMDDKIILLVHQKFNIDEYGKTRNLTQETVESILKKHNIDYKITSSDRYDYIREEEQKRLLKQPTYM